jgi:CDP-diacylglycerol--glycerol-3-phosphate 3-phosphatidyltransferase
MPDASPDQETGFSKLEPRDPEYRDKILTVPNVICFVRLIGAFVMLGLAVFHLPNWFVGLFVCLTISDWIDGRLARWLHQRSDFGARLDSFADAALYGALLLGCLILKWEVVQQELWWIGTALGSYGLSSVLGLIKYRRMPSYHTFAAKKSQALVLLAGVALVLDWSVWPLRLSALAVTLTNLEATALTWVLPEWRADVSSLWNVLETKRTTDR